jgi:phage tail P2-like protein
MTDYDVREVSLISALPLPLRNDPDMLALAGAIEEQLRKFAKEAGNANIYARIDELPEPVTDALAVDLHIDWYDAGAPPDVKRRVVKESVKVHKTLGTPYAVERALKAYYEDAEISEWFEYGGRPGYFKITVRGGRPADDAFEELAALIEKVKRKSAWLETIHFITDTPMAGRVRLAGLSAVKITRTRIPEAEPEAAAARIRRINAPQWKVTRTRTGERRAAARNAQSYNGLATVKITKTPLAAYGGD